MALPQPPWHGGVVRFRGPGVSQRVRRVTDGMPKIYDPASRSRNLTPERATLDGKLKHGAGHGNEAKPHRTAGASGHRVAQDA
ncbi:hypothetical protein GCM10017771_28420 [Streptomyces capitiformicae]|uniref:Uncharacterized protein n=1 Tax=Streptomyces capitiformicae TaxID=2014920 RepID=A0A919GMM8_9ACTN|nr:hypothetical protein GCM10017771_28420 [Streptomyces capitiformicae]